MPKLTPAATTVYRSLPLSARRIKYKDSAKKMYVIFGYSKLEKYNPSNRPTGIRSAIKFFVDSHEGGGRYAPRRGINIKRTLNTVERNFRPVSSKINKYKIKNINAGNKKSETIKAARKESKILPMRPRIIGLRIARVAGLPEYSLRLISPTIFTSPLYTAHARGA